RRQNPVTAVRDALEPAEAAIVLEQFQLAALALALGAVERGFGPRRLELDRARRPVAAVGHDELIKVAPGRAGNPRHVGSPRLGTASRSRGLSHGASAWRN